MSTSTPPDLAGSIPGGIYYIFLVFQGPWAKWVLPDSGQAVLPTTHDNEETYPLGLAVTFAVTRPLEQGRVFHACIFTFLQLLSISYKNIIFKHVIIIF
jgi:hypothetical protein